MTSFSPTSVTDIDVEIISTHGKLCTIEIIFRPDSWVDMDQIQIDNFNDKTYNLTTIDLIFMLKIYQEQDFDFLDHKGTKLNMNTIQRFHCGY